MAQNVISMYQSLYKQLIALQKQERTLSSQLASMRSAAIAAASQVDPDVVQRLQEIDEALNRIEIYISGAKNYVSLAQYTHVAEDVHFATLQQLYTMLSSSQTGRENAMQLLQKAGNARKYWLDEKTRIQSESKRKSSCLIQNANSGPEANRIKQTLDGIHSCYAQLSSGAEMRQLAAEIGLRSQNFFAKPNVAYAPLVPAKTTDTLCFGFAFFPFPMGQEYAKSLASVLGSFYSPTNRTIMLPLCFPAEKITQKGVYAATKLSVTYDDRTAAKSHMIMQGLLFNILRSYVPLRHRVVYLDFETFNPEYLGVMKEFAVEDSLIHFPANTDAAVSALQQLESEVYSEPEDNRSRRYLIIRGFASSGTDGKLTAILKKLSNDTRKNNVTVIYIDKQSSRKDFHLSQKPDVSMRIWSKDDCFVTDAWGGELRFGWLSPPGGITSQAIQNFHAAYKPKPIVNEYETFFKLNPQALYTRERKPISVPYGITSKGQILNLTFEGMEFASFIMGAAGSGKSTLIHAIIAGIIQNYHPDEVELWLADFKQSEFSPYVRHMPPHVKYILMDSSYELICDFINKLENELDRRKALLSKYTVNDRRHVPASKYLPALMIIIDEFSTLSDAVKDNDTYRKKLEKILREGRAPGLRLIFASQSYTGGAPVLTTLSKQQLGSRIAMKNDVDEIKQTLNVPSSQYTDRVRYEIDTLPKYYTLHHWQEGSGRHHVDKALTLYFDGKNEKGWESRFAFIDELKKRMRPVEQSEYNSRIVNQYVNKHPVIVSSDSLQVFSPKSFSADADQYRRSPTNVCLDSDILVSFGAPCKLEDNQLAVITAEPNENLFLLGSNKEIPCTMSVMLSTIRSFIAQNARIQVWADPRNPIFRTYKDTHFSKLKVSSGQTQVCTSIAQIVDNIRAGGQGNDLIVLLGMEQIYSKLNSDSGNGFFAKSTSKSSVNLSGLQATTEEEIREAEECEQDEIILNEMYEKLVSEGEAQGKTEEQIDKEFDLLIQKYMRDKYGIPASALSTADTSAEAAPNTAPPRDYLKEFHALIQEGSQYGYHFLVCINNYTALKSMGLSIGSFNHRLAFRTDSSDTASMIFDASAASKLNEHICHYAAYGSSNGRYNVIPYLHKGVLWDNWTLDENGTPRKLGQ